MFPNVRDIYLDTNIGNLEQIEPKIRRGLDFDNTPLVGNQGKFSFLSHLIDCWHPNQGRRSISSMFTINLFTMQYISLIYIGKYTSHNVMFHQKVSDWISIRHISSLLFEYPNSKLSSYCYSLNYDSRKSIISAHSFLFYPQGPYPDVTLKRDIPNQAMILF